MKYIPDHLCPEVVDKINNIISEKNKTEENNDLLSELESINDDKTVEKSNNCNLLDLNFEKNDDDDNNVKFDPFNIETSETLESVNVSNIKENENEIVSALHIDNIEDHETPLIQPIDEKSNKNETPGESSQGFFSGWLG